MHADQLFGILKPCLGSLTRLLLTQLLLTASKPVCYHQTSDALNTYGERMRRYVNAMIQSGFLHNNGGRTHQSRYYVCQIGVRQTAHALHDLLVQCGVGMPPPGQTAISFTDDDEIMRQMFSSLPRFRCLLTLFDPYQYDCQRAKALGISDKLFAKHKAELRGKVVIFDQQASCRLAMPVVDTLLRCHQLFG